MRKGTVLSTLTLFGVAEDNALEVGEQFLFALQMCENVAGSSPSGSEKVAKKVKKTALKNRKSLV